MNGLRQLTLSCNANRRRTGEVELIEGLLDLITNGLPGSWGLIYERNLVADDPECRYQLPGHRGGQGAP